MKIKSKSPSSPTRSSSAVSSKTYTYDEIAARARTLWEKKGRPEGRDEEIWYEAERELRSSDESRFANPDALLTKDGDPNDDIDERLNELTRPSEQRSATSL